MPPRKSSKPRATKRKDRSPSPVPQAGPSTRKARTALSPSMSAGPSRAAQHESSEAPGDGSGDVYEPDDFDLAVQADAAGARATAKGKAALEKVLAMASAPSETAKYSSAINSSRAAPMRFKAEPTSSLDLPPNFNLFPAVPLPPPLTQQQLALDIDRGLGEHDVPDAEEVYRDGGEQDIAEMGREGIQGGGGARRLGAGDMARADGLVARGDDIEEGDDEDLEDDLSDLDSETGLEGQGELDVDERDSDEQRARWAEIDEEMLRRKGQLEAAGAPVPVAVQQYTSPFTALAFQATTDGDHRLAARYLKSETRDLELHRFLNAVARATPLDLLPEVRAAYRSALVKFGQLPGFRVDHARGHITLLDPTKITSLLPSVFSAQTLREDGEMMHNLEALLAYMMLAKGRIREMFARSSARDDPTFRLSDIVGENDASRPPLASTVDDPGLYAVCPFDLFVMVGMTFALGISRRTRKYRTTLFPPSSKMGLIQEYMSEHGLEWPGTAYALMYHDVKIPGVDLPVPPGGVYAAETVLNVMIDCSRSTVQDIQDALDKRMEPTDDVNNASDRVLGCNTNISDMAGAFENQSGVGIAGARRIVDILIRLNRARIALPEFHPDTPSHPENDSSEALYRKLFEDVVPPDLQARSLYGYARLRTMTLRRALFDRRGDLADFDGAFLPGLNPLLALKAKWLALWGYGVNWR